MVPPTQGGRNPAVLPESPSFHAQRPTVWSNSTFAPKEPALETEAPAGLGHLSCWREAETTKIWAGVCVWTKQNKDQKTAGELGREEQIENQGESGCGFQTKVVSSTLIQNQTPSWDLDFPCWSVLWQELCHDWSVSEPGDYLQSWHGDEQVWACRTGPHCLLSESVHPCIHTSARLWARVWCVCCKSEREGQRGGGGREGEVRGVWELDGQTRRPEERVHAACCECTLPADPAELWPKLRTLW